MQQRYEQFLRYPTGARYLELRAMLLEEFSACQALPMLQLQRDIQGPEAVAVIQQQIDNHSRKWLLSPKFHLLIARFAEQQEDPEQLELSLLEARSCLAGLMATGDGSSQRPYLSTYPTDAQDVTAALGLRVDAQHLSRRKRQWFDLVTCDQRELWFARPLPAASPVVPAFR